MRHLQVILLKKARQLNFFCLSDAEASLRPTPVLQSVMSVPLSELERRGASASPQSWIALLPLLLSPQLLRLGVLQTTLQPMF